MSETFYEIRDGYYCKKYEYNMHTCVTGNPNFDGKIVGNVSLAVQYARV